MSTFKVLNVFDDSVMREIESPCGCKPCTIVQLDNEKLLQA
ncbi:hypothetical protein ACF3NG_11340 [Aerococcaceae bacterium WGS1372]